jgi:hypothetical protein
MHKPETKAMMFLPGGEKMRYGGELPHLSLILHENLDIFDIFS